MQTTVFIAGMALYIGIKAILGKTTFQAATIDIAIISITYIAIQYIWRLI